MKSLLPLLILSAGPSLTSPDIAQRKQAAEAWSRRHGVALSASTLEARTARGVDCIRLRAPAPTGCRESVELCAWVILGGVCSGSWSTDVILRVSDGGSSFQFIQHDGSSVDSYACETAVPEVTWLADGGTTPVRGRQQEVDACIRKQRAELASEETHLRCDVMTVNPCLGEAYLVCRGRLRGEPYRRTSWVSWADGGADAEREFPIDFEDDPDDGG